CTSDVATLSLHDALPISRRQVAGLGEQGPYGASVGSDERAGSEGTGRPRGVGAGGSLLGARNAVGVGGGGPNRARLGSDGAAEEDRKSTRLNSSHVAISY